MLLHSRLRCATLLLLLIAPAIAGQTRSASPLIADYNSAQELQRAGKMNEAAEQYRAFLAEALGRLAMEYSAARDYQNAAPLFDEALLLEPDSPFLLLEYARAALTLGAPDHAKTLAAEFVQRYPSDRAQLAQAHQLLGRALLKLNRDQEARKELEEAVALDPTFANGYDLAVACLDLDDEKCAVQIFSEMETSFGDTAELHLAFGRAYGESDFQPRAIAELHRTIQENPRLPGAHYLLAAMLLASGNGDSATAEAEAALKEESAISPRDSVTYTALGKIALTRGRYSEAESYLKKAASLGPSSPDPYLYLGQMYFESNRFADAEAALRQCIRLTTDVSRNRYQVQKAHFLLGRILMKDGDQAAAHQEMQVARELANKTLAHDKSSLAGLMDVARSPSALETAPASSVNTDSATLRNAEVLRSQLKLPVADSYNNLGAIAASSANYATAVSYFTHAAAWNPSLDGLDYNWGRAAFAGSQFAEAIPPLSRYLKAHPDDLGARNVLGISRFMNGDYPGCLETMQPAIDSGNLAPQADYVYAESLVKTGQLDSGISRLRLLRQQHPGISDVHRSLGEAFEQRGDTGQAMTELRTAVQLNNQDAAAYHDLGRIELNSGDATAAITDLEKSVQLSPRNAVFHEELAKGYMAAQRTQDAQREMEICKSLRSHTSADSSISQDNPRALATNP